MNNFKKYSSYIFIFILFTIVVYIIFLIYIRDFNNKYLKVVFLDVGQGDSIYIESPNKTQILIDGGPNTQVLSRLSKVMPFGDRSIDLVIATHFDSDHIGGLVDILDTYKVNTILENGTIYDTKVYNNLEDRILKNNINKIIAKRGMKFILDKEKNIYFEILFPNTDVSNLDSNEGSIVGRLVYNKKSFMFTGDAPISTELLVYQLDKNKIRSSVLKLGHHGSRTSSGLLWLENVSPEISVISAGRDNRYGHPHKETLNRLNTLSIPYLSTYLKGNIVFKTDGINLKY